MMRTMMTSLLATVFTFVMMTAADARLQTPSRNLQELTPVFSEDFEKDPVGFGQMTFVDVAEPDAVWGRENWDFGTTYAAQANGFGASGPTEDWLLTPVINFDFMSNQELTYRSQISFDGPAPQVVASTDYDASMHSDPNDATWDLIYTDTTANDSLTPVGPFDLTSLLPTKGTIAFRYVTNGGAGGEGVRFTIDDITVNAVCGFDFEGEEGSNIEDDASSPWTVVNVGSSFGWVYQTYGGSQGAINNNFGSDGPADDYLISPAFASTNKTVIEFHYYEIFGDNVGLQVLVTTDWTGDVETTQWVDVTPENLDGSTDDAYVPKSTDPVGLGIEGSNARVAFRYQASGTGGGETKRIGVDKVCISESKIGGPLTGTFEPKQIGKQLSFETFINGGFPPYTFAWTFGDGASTETTDDKVQHEYPSEAGSYDIDLLVTDSQGQTFPLATSISVTAYDFPQSATGDIRIASYNVAMNRGTLGALAEELTQGSPQAESIAAVIQRVNPDAILVNEFDQIWKEDGTFDLEATLASIETFQADYLGVSQNGYDPVRYDHVYVAPCNTGVQSGYDLDNSDSIGEPGDAWGFGSFPGQYAMIFLSKYPIKEDEVRTFQHFLWKDMPDNLIPTPYYNEEEVAVFRLSSKSHWDIPIDVNGETVHCLCSHPTPPVFDDEENDWNGRRNFDEIRLWSDYIVPGQSGYIYDDAEYEAAGNMTPDSPSGGLSECDRFVILGDQNADPLDGDSTGNPIGLLLESPHVDTSMSPKSPGSLEKVPSTYSNRDEKTATFDLRADYALPSTAGFTMTEARTYWPALDMSEADNLYFGSEQGSDHRLVMVDLNLIDCGNEEVPSPTASPVSPTTAPVDESTPTAGPGDSSAASVGFSVHFLQIMLAMFCGFILMC